MRRRPGRERGKATRETRRRWVRGRPDTVRGGEGRQGAVRRRGARGSRRWRGRRVGRGERGRASLERVFDPRRARDRVTWVRETPETLGRMEGRWRGVVVIALWIPRVVRQRRWRRKPGLRPREWTRAWMLARGRRRWRGARGRESLDRVEELEDFYQTASRAGVDGYRGDTSYRSLLREEGEIQVSRRGELHGRVGSLERESFLRFYGVGRWRALGDSLGGEEGTLPTRSALQRRDEERRPWVGLWHRGLAFFLASGVRNRLDLLLLLRRRTEVGRGRARRQRILSEREGGPVFHLGESRFLRRGRGWWRLAG